MFSMLRSTGIAKGSDTKVGGRSLLKLTRELMLRFDQ